MLQQQALQAAKQTELLQLQQELAALDAVAPAAAAAACSAGNSSSNVGVSAGHAAIDSFGFADPWAAPGGASIKAEGTADSSSLHSWRHDLWGDHVSGEGVGAAVQLPAPRTYASALAAAPTPTARAADAATGATADAWGGNNSRTGSSSGNTWLKRDSGRSAWVGNNNEEAGETGSGKRDRDSCQYKRTPPSQLAPAGDAEQYDGW